MTLREMIEGSAFGDRLDERGLLPGIWLLDRQNEERGQHWICATLYNEGVGDYDTLCTAYMEYIRENPTGEIDTHYACFTRKEYAHGR